VAVMRRAAQRDANEPGIIDKARKLGASVQPLNDADIPDLLIGFRGRNFLVELKDGDKVPSKRKLRPGQKRWHERWRGQVAKCETWEEVLAVLTADTR